LNKKLIELEARAFNKVKFQKELSIYEVETILNTKLPNKYKEILEDFNGSAISFEKGAKYIPDISPPIIDSDGYLALDFFYGIIDNNLNILYQNECYLEQLPTNLITIGEVLSGDQICFNKLDKSIVYWWHEAPLSDKKTFRIANSFSDFIAKLEPDDNIEEDLEKKIIMSESYLDF